MRSARFEVARRVLGADPATYLQTAGIRAQCFSRRGFVARAQHDDMATAETIVLVKFCKPSGGPISDEVGAHPCVFVTKCAADDLLYFALMQIDARPEHALKLAATKGAEQEAGRDFGQIHGSLPEDSGNRPIKLRLV